MSYDLFLSIPNIPGESTAKGFENQIVVYSYSFGASIPVTVDGSTNPPTGKPSLSDLSILKAFDKSSPYLFRSLVQGKNIASQGTPGIILSVVPTGAVKASVTYALQDVYVSSLSDSGSTGGDSEPTESISFAFGVLRITYVPQNPDGSAGTAISVAYNRETNKSA